MVCDVWRTKQHNEHADEHKYAHNEYWHLLWKISSYHESYKVTAKRNGFILEDIRYINNDQGDKISSNKYIF
jgi:hypothetical protein